MNRAQRRAEAARDKMQRNSERVRSLVEERDELAIRGEQFRTLLFALARKDGRVVARGEDIRALGEKDRIDFVTRENGDVVVEFTQG